MHCARFGFRQRDGGACPGLTGRWAGFVVSVVISQLYCVIGVVQMLKYIRNVFITFLFTVVFSLSHAASVDINTADAAALAQGISGIGPSKAQAIVDYRTANGLFASVDDLVRVQGIGSKTLERIRDFIIVMPGAGASADPSVSEGPASSPDEQPALQAN